MSWIMPCLILFLFGFEDLGYHAARWLLHVLYATQQQFISHIMKSNEQGGIRGRLPFFNSPAYYIAMP